MREAGRWVVKRGNVERISTGTQHFNQDDVRLGMSAASHIVLRNQDFASIVERRRRNYFLLYAMLRDVAPPVTRRADARRVAAVLSGPHAQQGGRHGAALVARRRDSGLLARAPPSGSPRGDFPEVDELRETVLELPVHQDLSPADAEHVATCVRELLK